MTCAALLLIVLVSKSPTRDDVAASSKNQTKCSCDVDFSRKINRTDVIEETRSYACRRASKVRALRASLDPLAVDCAPSAQSAAPSIAASPSSQQLPEPPGWFGEDSAASAERPAAAWSPRTSTAARPPPDVTRRNLKSDPSPAPAARASCLLVHRGLRLPSKMRTTGSGVDHVPLTPISGATSVPPSDSADGYSLGAGGSSPFSCASALCSLHRRRNSRSVAGSRCCNVGKRKRERGGSERSNSSKFSGKGR